MNSRTAAMLGVSSNKNDNLVFMKFFNDILLIISLLIFSSCANQQDNHPSLSPEYLNELTTRLSGKSFQTVNGNFEKGKTFVFIVDKHNWVFSDSGISSELKKSNILTEDSVHLKTVTLIYHPVLWRQLDEDNDNKLAFKICFVDLNSLIIKKIIELPMRVSFQESKNEIAKAIINEFNH